MWEVFIGIGGLDFVFVVFGRICLFFFFIVFRFVFLFSLFFV